MAKDLSFRTYADAIGGELTRQGFTLAPGLATSELVAVVDVKRGFRPTMGEDSPVRIGIGGGSFGGNVGVGGGVSFPAGKRREREIVTTDLSVQLKRRSEGTVIWEGRASMQAITPNGEPSAAITRLAGALFRDFPGESGRTITVK